MSFSRAERFPTLSTVNRTDEQKIDKDAECLSPCERFNKHSKANNGVQRPKANRSLTYDKDCKVRREQSNFKRNASRRSLPVTKSELLYFQLNSEEVNLNCSTYSVDDEIFYDVLENIDCDKKSEYVKVQEVDNNQHSTDDKNTKNYRRNRNTAKKHTSNAEHDNETIRKVQELHNQIVRNISKETRTKFDALLEDVNRIHDKHLEKMNRRYMEIVSNTETGEFETCTVVAKLQEENNFLKRVVKEHSNKMQKNEQQLRDMDCYYMDLLDKAEKKIHDCMNTISILTEEICSMALTKQLQNVLKSQEA